MLGQVCRAQVAALGLSRRRVVDVVLVYYIQSKIIEDLKLFETLNRIKGARAQRGYPERIVISRGWWNE